VKSGRRLLVVDDQEVITYLLSVILRERGFEVDTAVDAREALQKADRAELVLLDVMLPEMDGWQVLDALRRQPGTARLPVIVMSAAIDPLYSKRAREAGARYLEKPFPMATLLQVIDTLIPPPTVA
jgi:CheY-like chemotaxis protein